MKYEKPDGVIELANNACCCPPGSIREGQHTNGLTSWWRVNDGPWHRQVERSSHYRTLAMAAETCHEFATAAYDPDEEMHEFCMYSRTLDYVNPPKDLPTQPEHEVMAETKERTCLPNHLVMPHDEMTIEKHQRLQVQMRMEVKEVKIRYMPPEQLEDFKSILNAPMTRIQN